MKSKKKVENKFVSILINKYLWIILIPDLFILYFIIKYSSVLLIAFLLNDPNLSKVGGIIALFIVKAIIDIIVSIKIIKQEI